MRRMERQAQQTDRAMARLAMTTDRVGAPQQTRNITQSERALRSYGGEVDRVGSRTRRLTRDLDEHTSKWGRLKQAITMTGAAIRGFGAIMGAIKLPAMGVGIGVLVQAIGALSGGVIALLPRIADLAGGLAALPATIAGVGLAMGTIKLATADLSKALTGNKNALKALTPEARRFVATLKEYQPVLREIRRSAQQGLFPGLDYSLRRLQRAVPTVQRLVGTMGRHIGAAASTAANRFTTPGFLADFEGIGRQGIQMFDRFAGALINVVDGLRHLTMAARPFTEWVGRLIERFGVWFRNWAQFQRDSGRFATYLQRTRSSLTLFAHILENVWNFFRGIGRAARPLGDMLWRDAERATRAWGKYANSVAGQLRLTRQFLSMHDSIQAIVTLFDDLARAIFRMGTSTQLPGIARTLDQMVPSLERLFDLFVSTFGPTAADLLNQLARTLTFIVGATGPLNIMLSLLARILELFNNLVDAVPGLGRVLSTALSVVTIGLFINKVRLLAASWFGVAAGARAAAGAEAAATGVSMLGGPGIGGMGRRGAGLGRAARFGRAGIATAALGRVVVPIAGAMGAFGAFQARNEGVGQIARQFLSGLTGGIYNPPTRGESLSRYQSEYTQDLRTDLERYGGAHPQTLGQVRGSLRYLRAIHPQAGSASRGDVAGVMTTVREEIRIRRILLGTLVREKNQRDRALGYQRVRQLGQAYDIYARRLGPTRALNLTGQELADQMQTLGPTGRRVLGKAALSWAAEMERQGRPGFKGATAKIRELVEGSFKTMGDRVRVVNNQIFTGTKAEWNRIRFAMTNPAERAREAVERSFTAIQLKALGSLQAMGFSAAQAQRLVAGMERSGVTPSSPVAPGVAGAANTIGGILGGGRGRASGGRIWAPGFGMGDSVSLGGGQLGGKGELVVNQHTERKVNYLLGGRTTLGGMVANEGRAHGSFAHGGRGGGYSGLQPGITNVMNDVLGHFPGLSVTSTTTGNHAKNSYHYRGMAVDLGGPPGVMNAASDWISSTIGRSLLEGIHNPNLSIKNGRQVGPGFWGPVTWQQHINHIHLAAGAGGGARGGFAGMPGGVGRVALGQLVPAPSGLGGVPGGLADQAGLLMAAGATARLNQMLGGAGGPGADGGGAPTANMNLAYRMMLARGWGPGEWGALRSLWTGESGFRTTARNASSGAYGIPQALPGSKMASAGADWLTNPATQIAWGLGYIQSRYGSPTQAYASWQSRSPHWYGDGGEFVARKPMLIGVGDKGSEHVSITPTHRGLGGRPILLKVEIGRIENHREGDIQRIVHNEFERLADELDLTAMVGDEETIR